jgi:hypothetical protein
MIDIASQLWRAVSLVFRFWRLLLHNLEWAVIGPQPIFSGGAQVFCAITARVMIPAAGHQAKPSLNYRKAGNARLIPGG